jgi:hypothetical protein
VPLSFLGAGDWKLRAFADTQASAVTPTELAETSSTIRTDGTLTLTLAPAGGYAATLTPASAP